MDDGRRRARSSSSGAPEYPAAAGRGSAGGARTLPGRARALHSPRRPGPAAAAGAGPGPRGRRGPAPDNARVGLSYSIRLSGGNSIKGLASPRIACIGLAQYNPEHIAAPWVEVSILSWRLTAPLRRMLERRPPSDWTQLDLMGDALRHLHQKGFRPSVVLDVGAAQGYWSQAAGAVFPEAAFYLFDPLQENEASLRALVRRDPRFHYSLVALGSERGTHRLNLAQDPNASSLLDFPGQDAAAQREVPVETVDHLLATGRIPQARSREARRAGL